MALNHGAAAAAAAGTATSRSQHHECSFPAPYRAAEHLIELREFLVASGIQARHAVTVSRVFHDQEVAACTAYMHMCAFCVLAAICLHRLMCFRWNGPTAGENSGQLCVGVQRPTLPEAAFVTVLGSWDKNHPSLRGWSCFVPRNRRAMEAGPTPSRGAALGLNRSTGARWTTTATAGRPPSPRDRRMQESGEA